jgi:RNA polymerase sigma factor (sigma-70 family)
MFEGPREFRDLMRAMQGGCREAAARICREYERTILRVVRRRLMKRLRSQFDSQDFLHDVWASFFTDPPLDRQFDNPAALGLYLEKMTQYKVIETSRTRLNTSKRDLRREVPIMGTDDAGLARFYETPSQVLVAQEERDRMEHDFEEMLVRLPPQQRQILLMLRQGLSREEIAQRLNTCEKTIRRLLRRVTTKKVAHE